jgi:signal transduction histidine kinase
MRILESRWRVAILLGCPLLIAAIGYGDYIEGSENSMLLLYLVPIGLATWYVGMVAGFAMALLSSISDVTSDILAQVPQSNWWDLLTTIIYFAIFIVLLSRCHNLIETMRARIEERTVELREEIVARKELERKMALAEGRERREIGQEIHDGLCQHLTGTALKARIVATELQRQGSDTMERAGEVVGLLNNGIKIAREIARGLFSSDLEGEELLPALDMLATRTSRDHAIQCELVNDTNLFIPSDKGTQLYWIAREAVNNAVTHAKASRIQIRLKNSGDHLTLSILDDGLGLKSVDAAPDGIGLQVMARRAELAGGNLVLGQSEWGGAVVCCKIRTNGSVSSNSKNV